MSQQKPSLENRSQDMMLSIDILNHNEEVFKKFFNNPQPPQEEEINGSDNTE